MGRGERDFFAVNLVERVGDRAKGVMQKLGLRKDAQIDEKSADQPGSYEQIR